MEPFFSFPGQVTSPSQDTHLAARGKLHSTLIFFTVGGNWSTCRHKKNIQKPLRTTYSWETTLRHPPSTQFQLFDCYLRTSLKRHELNTSLVTTKALQILPDGSSFMERNLNKHQSELQRLQSKCRAAKTHQGKKKKSFTQTFYLSVKFIHLFIWCSVKDKCKHYCYSRVLKSVLP